MKNRNLQKILKSLEDLQVTVKIEDGLYYPIKTVYLDSNNIILLCRDITKMEETK